MRTSILYLLGLMIFWSLATQATLEKDIIPGEYIAKIKKNKKIKRFGRFGSRGYISSIHHTQDYVLISRPKIETPEVVVKALNSEDIFEYVEPNYVYRTTLKPNDPRFFHQWAVNGTSPYGIQVAPVWAHTRESNLIVAVIDTGVDYNHPDLKDNILVHNKELEGITGIDDDGNGYIDDIYGMNFVHNNRPTSDPMDDLGHGTHCAGIIGAVGDNHLGVTGVTWKGKILPIRFLSADGEGSLAGAISSIEYALSRGARIISNSWSSPDHSQALLDVIRKADNKGVLLVVSSGNDAQDNDQKPTYPANYPVPNVISVASIGREGRLSSFSSYGKRTVHLAAPGEDILSTYLNSGYIMMSGTSMAAPFVAGAAALLWSLDPELSHIQVKQRLLSHVLPIENLKDKVRSGGALDIAAAVFNKNTPSETLTQDPMYWNHSSVRMETPNPYPSYARLEYVVRVPRAQRMAIFFERLWVENNYDFVLIYDRHGKLIQKITGEHRYLYSDIIEDHYAKVVLVSDFSIERSGFKIPYIAYQ
jgi:thermitase